MRVESSIQHNYNVVSVIPDFDRDGRLPSGIHKCDWAEFATRFGWNPHRQRLLTGLERALRSLKFAGCTRAFLDGSFVTAKDQPDDFDGCWEATSVDLSLLDPILKTFDPGRTAQKAKFFGEMFPAEFFAGKAGLRYMEFFQQDKDGNPKGIIELDLRSLP